MTHSNHLMVFSTLDIIYSMGSIIESKQSLGLVAISSILHQLIIYLANVIDFAINFMPNSFTCPIEWTKSLAFPLHWLKDRYKETAVQFFRSLNASVEYLNLINFSIKRMNVSSNERFEANLFSQKKREEKLPYDCRLIFFDEGYFISYQIKIKLTSSPRERERMASFFFGTRLMARHLFQRVGWMQAIMNWGLFWSGFNSKGIFQRAPPHRPKRKKRKRPLNIYMPKRNICTNTSCIVLIISRFNHAIHM